MLTQEDYDQQEIEEVVNRVEKRLRPVLELQLQKQKSEITAFTNTLDKMKSEMGSLQAVAVQIKREFDIDGESLEVASVHEPKSANKNPKASVTSGAITKVTKETLGPITETTIVETSSLEASEVSGCSASFQRFCMRFQL